VVKLFATLNDLISGRKPQALPPPIVVNKEPEWEVEEVLDSRWHWRRFQFLIKWKSFSREHNSWEVALMSRHQTSSRSITENTQPLIMIDLISYRCLP